MAMNTPYLGSSASAAGATSGVSNLNTSYLSTGLTELTSSVSIWGTLQVMGGGGLLVSSGSITQTGGTASFSTLLASVISTTGGTVSATSIVASNLSTTGAISGTAGTFSSITVGTGLATLSASSLRGLADFQSTRTQAGLLSFQTTASAASTILPDGAFGVYYLSNTSMALAFRSGVTTYTIRATAASVL